MMVVQNRPLALITGGAGGLGFAAADGLLRAGYDVLLTDRDASAGQRAAKVLAERYPQRQVEFRFLDLADLQQIKKFASQLQQSKKRLDCLINNAGVFPPHARLTTQDGIELAFGIGFYGHFALTAGLLDCLLRADKPRVVTVSSIAHAGASLPLNDAYLEQRYDATRAYASCKLACLVFALELDRRAKAAGLSLQSLAAHPGIARTAIGQYADNTPRNLRDRAVGGAMALAMRLFGQTAEQGALPIIHAAIADDLQGGEFIGPTGFRQFSGPCGVVKAHGKTMQGVDAGALWAMAEEVCQRRFEWG